MVKLIDRETIEAALVQRLNLDPPRAAQLLDTIGDVIAQSISTGQMEDVQGQLPEAL
jgi:hypothetical protein